MNSRQFVVRIVKPSPEPALPRVQLAAPPKPIKKRSRLFMKVLDVLTGSTMGIFAGVAIYLMLKLVGIDFGGLESSLIIGLPGALAIITSLVVC